MCTGIPVLLFFQSYGQNFVKMSSLVQFVEKMKLSLLNQRDTAECRLEDVSKLTLALLDASMIFCM